VISCMHASAVMDPERKSGHGPSIQFGHRLWPPSNEDINARYWKTCQIPPSRMFALMWTLAERLDPPVCVTTESHVSAFIHVIKKLDMCDITHDLYTPFLCHNCHASLHSLTPSLLWSITYFMDDPLYIFIKILIHVIY